MKELVNLEDHARCDFLHTAASSGKSKICKSLDEKVGCWTTSVNDAPQPTEIRKDERIFSFVPGRFPVELKLLLVHESSRSRRTSRSVWPSEVKIK